MAYAQEKKLADDVFHALQSVPVNIGIPLVGKTQYGRGLASREELKQVVVGLVQRLEGLKVGGASGVRTDQQTDMHRDGCSS